MADLTGSGTLVITSLPPKCLTGIDLLSFTPGPNFRGIKSIPPGWHFVFASSTDSLTLRQGIWLQVHEASKEPQLLFAQWDAKNEVLHQEVDQSKIMMHRANLGSIWNNLFAYRQKASSSNADAEDDDYEDIGDWAQLSEHISEPLLSRILGPLDKTHWGWALSSGSSAKQDIDVIPGIEDGSNSIDHEKDLNFLPINLKQTWREGATGRERTEAVLDRSWALSELQKLCAASSVMEVLGELEFCFLMVLTISNYSCLEQWKRILGILFTCKRAVEDHPDLFIQTLKILRLQLQRNHDVEGGLFDMSADGSALLRGLLRKFKNGLDDISGKGKLDVVDELDELESYIKEEYGWDLSDSFVKRGMLDLEDGERVEVELSGYEEDDETGEYAPTIVDLTTAQKRTVSSEEESDEPETKRRSLSSKGNEEDDEDDRDVEDMDARF
jgi:A1 cistron-splicing factor AAR2